MLEIKLSPNLILKQLRLEDAETLFQLVSENRTHLRQWLPWLDNNQTVVDQKKFIEGTIKKQKENGSFDVALWFKEELAGVAGFHPIDWPNKKVGLGYWLAKSFQGKGLATQAASALTQHAFSEFKLNRVEIRCALGNTASQKIPLRLGFTQEGVECEAEFLYDHYVDHVVFAMLAKNWSLENAR